MSRPASRVLALVGTVLVGLPLVAPLGLAVIFLIAGGGFHLDVLLPGELIAVVVAGGVALVAAALVARRRRVSTALLAGAVVLLFALTTVLSLVTGLASGSTPAEGWPLVVVIASYSLYVVAVIALFIAGVLLTRELARTAPGR